MRIELDQTVSESVNRLLSERVGKRKAEAAAASKEFLATAATNPNATQTATGLVVEHLAEVRVGAMAWHTSGVPPSTTPESRPSTHITPRRGHGRGADR